VHHLLRAPLAAALAAVLGLLLLGAASGEDAIPSGASSGVETDLLPEAARTALPLVEELTARQCPELPPVWVIAQIEAESGWDPGAAGTAAGGAAGLLQLSEATWTAAGGAPWTADPPGPGDEVTDTDTHLRVAIPWLCATLRAVGGHLTDTGKQTDPLDAMLVCHIAGCGRVTGSASGIPQTGEADCSARCAEIVARYLDAVHDATERFAAHARPTEPAEDAAEGPEDPGTAEEPEVAGTTPAAWTGGDTGCTLDDPTRADGCLTGAARHGLDAASAAFGGWSDGPVLRHTGCWDAHAWNPRSDHPRGRACDLFPTTAGTFPEGAELDAGWQVADWFREHAEPLRVKYLIWQGRYWDPSVEDSDGWGRRYTGGGVYDVRDATGGHYDHIHVSFRE
jgi:hypothetical protein